MHNLKLGEKPTIDIMFVSYCKQIIIQDLINWNYKPNFMFTWNLNLIRLDCISFFFRIVTYLFLFGPSFKPLYQKSLNWPSAVSEILTPKTKSNPDKEPTLFHSCVLTPDIIRDEVEMLKVDFNNRVKQILFNSMLTAYYMTFVPLCFAQVGTLWLTHLCRVDSPILLNWINLFPKLGMSCIFISIFRIFLTEIPLSKQRRMTLRFIYL